MAAYEKIVLITRKTRLEELVARFNTKRQARFYIEQSGGDFAAYQAEDDAYRAALDTVRAGIDLGLKTQAVERGMVPTFAFTDHDAVVALGQDGLVANCAKYLGPRPLVAVNPDPARFDGILLPFQPAGARAAVAGVLEGKETVREVTLAEAALNNGQTLRAFNDFFIGAGSHVSARYRIKTAEGEENQSSSGVLVVTGAGSTGWLSSVFNMAAGVARFTGGAAGKPRRWDWGDPRLLYVVREPFASRHSGAALVMGAIDPGGEFEVESHMPLGGVIFSDGVEADRLDFNAGAVMRVRAVPGGARLVWPAKA